MFESFYPIIMDIIQCLCAGASRWGVKAFLEVGRNKNSEKEKELGKTKMVQIEILATPKRIVLKEGGGDSKGPEEWSE